MIYHLFLTLAVTAPMQDGAASIDRLLACEATSDKDRRLACYDAEARAIRGMRTAAVRALEPKAAAEPRAAFAPVASTVRAVTPLRPGFWRAVLADGSAWRNVEWTGPLPRTGAPIAIRKGSLGSLWAKTEGMPSMKVRREP